MSPSPLTIHVHLWFSASEYNSKDKMESITLTSGYFLASSGMYLPDQVDLVNPREIRSVMIISTVQTQLVLLKN